MDTILENQQMYEVELVGNLKFLKYAARESQNENVFDIYKKYDAGIWDERKILPQFYKDSKNRTAPKPFRDSERLKESLTDLYMFRQSNGWEMMMMISMMPLPDLSECSMENQEKGQIYSNFYYDAAMSGVDQANYGQFFESVADWIELQ